MSETKKIAACLLLCVFVLGACGKSADKGSALIYDKEAVDVATEGYKTFKPEKGTYTKLMNFEGSVYFPNKEEIAYKGSEAVLKEICVTSGAEVKAGDVIAKIEVIYDELDLKKLELDIENAKTAYEAGLKAFPDTKEGKAQKELYSLENHRYLDSLEKAYDDYKERISVTTVCAENDGVVSDIAQINMGDKLTNGTYIATTYDPSEVWMQLNDVSGDLRYGMTVNIETGVAKNRQQLEAVVLYCDDILPDSLKRGVTYARFTETPQLHAFMNTSIKAAITDISGVILVPRNAVEQDDSDNFVTTIENGKPHKRQVIKGGQNTDVAWILRGLDETIDVVNGR